MASSIIGALAHAAEKYSLKGEPWLEKILVRGEKSAVRQGVAATEAWRLINTTQEEADRLAGPHLADWLEVSKNAPRGEVAAELKSGNLTKPASIVAKTKMDNVFQNFVSEGLVKPSRAVQNYWPKMYPAERFEGRGLDDVLNHLVTTGQAKTKTEAERLLQMTTSGGSKFMNIEKRRLANLPGEREDNAVVSDYIMRGYKRIAQKRNFGPNDEVLDELLDRVRNESGQKGFEYTKWLLEQKLGRRIGMQGSVPGLGHTNIEKAAGSLEALTKLSLASINQASQFVNIPLVLRGISPMVRGMARVAADYGDARRFAMESGAVLHDVYNAARQEALGELNVGGQVLKYSGFTWLDKNLRILASESGRVAVQDAFENLAKNPVDKDAIQLLHTLGVDSSSALKRGALTPEEIQIASRRASDLSQFRTDVGSVPPAWRSNPYGRTVMMYKNYAYQQTTFLKKFVVEPALKGDFKPLLYMSILFPTVGEVTADIGDLIRKGNLKDRPKYETERVIDNMAHVGAFGIMYDMARSMSYNDASAFWRFLGGPILSDVIDVTGFSARTLLNSKHPLNALGEGAKRKLLRSIPVVGPRIDYETHGKKSTYKSPLQRGTVTKALSR